MREGEVRSGEEIWVRERCFFRVKVVDLSMNEVVSGTC